MGSIKIYFFLYLYYWLRLLLIVCCDVESQPGSGFDKKVRVLHSNIRGLHANLDELAVAGSDYDVLLCAESKVSDRRHLLEFRIPGFRCPLQTLRNSTPGAQDMALNIREGFRFYRQSKLEYSCHESCLFRICSRINNFYVYVFYRNPGHDGSLYYCPLTIPLTSTAFLGRDSAKLLLWINSMSRVQTVDDKAVFVFVGDANAHHSEWLQSVSPTDRHGRDGLDLFNLSDCEQLVR